MLFAYIKSISLHVGGLLESGLENDLKPFIGKWKIEFKVIGHLFLEKNFFFFFFEKDVFCVLRHNLFNMFV